MLRRRVMSQNEYDKSIPFDVHLLSDDKRAKKVFQQVLEIIRPEIEHGYKRHTKAYNAVIQAVVLSMIHCHENRHCYWVGISLNKNAYKTNSRYNKLRIGYGPLRKVIDAMVKCELVDFHVGFYDQKREKGRNTRLGLTPKLIGLLYQSKNKTQTYRDMELVRLKGPKVRRGSYEYAPLIEYEDTMETHRMRRVLETLNEGFMGAEITSGLTDRQEVRQAKHLKQAMDYTRKHVYRVFNETFEKGGRFYGPWWQGCKKENRPFILINGCPTVELDYASLHPRMLHHMQGLVPPAGDLYEIEGQEQHRGLCKIIFNCLLNAPTVVSAVRAVRDKFYRQMRQPHLIKGIDLNGLAEKLKAKHQPIAQHLGSGVGVTLQYHDSCIAERVMMELHDKGIICLPVHDSFIVAEQYEAILREAMMEAYFERLGKYPLIG